MLIFKEQGGEPTQTPADRTRTRYAQVYISHLLCHSFCRALRARGSNGRPVACKSRVHRSEPPYPLSHYREGQGSERQKDGPGGRPHRAEMNHGQGAAEVRVVGRAVKR